MGSQAMESIRNRHARGGWFWLHFPGHSAALDPVAVVCARCYPMPRRLLLGKRVLSDFLGQDAKWSTSPADLCRNSSCVVHCCSHTSQPTRWNSQGLSCDSDGSYPRRFLLGFFEDYGCCVAAIPQTTTKVKPLSTEAAHRQTPPATPPVPVCPEPVARAHSR